MLVSRLCSVIQKHDPKSKNFVTQFSFTGLPPGPIRALTKLLETPEACEDVIGILREAISEMRIRDWVNDQIKLKINVKLWGVVGCHELLAALGLQTTRHLERLYKN